MPTEHSHEGTTLNPNTAHQCLSKRLDTLTGYGESIGLSSRHGTSRATNDDDLLWHAIPNLKRYKTNFTTSRNLSSRKMSSKKTKPASGVGSDAWVIEQHSKFWQDDFGLKLLSQSAKDLLKWDEVWNCRCEESAKSTIGGSYTSFVEEDIDLEEANDTVPENWDDW